MRKDRFEAFFDAVMAIIMTIVVLEFAIPKGTDWYHSCTYMVPTSYHNISNCCYGDIII